MSWADAGSASESASATTQSVVVAVVIVIVPMLVTALEAARIVGAARALVNRRRRVRTQRPLCPYPAAAVYKGSGSTDDASSFQCRDEHGDDDDHNGDDD